jgi:shikimate kinase
MIGENTIFLIGMMGSGKSTIGVRLAELLVLPFIDTDAAIEKKEGRTIQQIFEQEGEVYFREKEQQLLQQLPQQAGVVACGGGLPCFYDNMELLKSKGIVVYLEAAAEQLFERIKGDDLRPKLRDVKAFKLLKAQREATYQKAHFRIDANQTIEQILAQVLSLRTATTNQ